MEFYYMVALVISLVSQIIFIKSVSVVNKRYKRSLLMIYWFSGSLHLQPSSDVIKINMPR